MHFSILVLLFYHRTIVLSSYFPKILAAFDAGGGLLTAFRHKTKKIPRSVSAGFSL